MTSHADDPYFTFTYPGSVVLPCEGEVPFRSAQTVHSARPRGVEACTKGHMARGDQGTIRLLERLSNSIGRPGPSSTPSIGHITSTYAVVRSDLIQLKNGEDIGATYASFVSISCVNMLHLQAIPIHLLLAHLNVLWLEGADHWQRNRFHKSEHWARLCLDTFILYVREPTVSHVELRETISGLSKKIYLVEMICWDVVDVRQPAVSGIGGRG